MRACTFNGPLHTQTKLEFRATSSTPRGVTVLAFAAGLARCATPAPESDWVGAFGYSEAAVHSVHIGAFGYPDVSVQIGDTNVGLPFDTGNTVGLSVSSALFDRLGLTAVDSSDRVNSAGETIATLRV